MEKISIKINDQDIIAHKGATILETALANKIYIPYLCYHPDLKPAGSCRICLVELDDGKLVTSCRTPVKEGMVIKTKSAELDKVRRPIVEMIIANHHMDCKNCAKKGQCTLQRITGYMKIDKKRIQQNLRFPKEELPLDDSNPFFIRDHNKCVLCGICVRTCQEIQKVSAIDFAGRGYSTKIATLGDKPIAQSRCESCGECVIRCPVGALVFKNLRRPAQEVKTICPYCSVGCSIFLGIRDNVIVNVRGDKESPINKGHLCVKGRFGLSFVHSPDRLTSPLIRKNENNPPSPPFNSPLTKGGYRGVEGGMGGFVEISWDEALELVANKLRNYKGEEFALIASPKCTNEDNYIAQKFARVVMGTNNIDTSVRLCHAPSIAALHSIYTPLFKRGAWGDFKDGGGFIHGLEKAACILVVGANVTRSHPVLDLKIKKAVENGAKLIVISPKEIDLCRFAEIWMKPYPGTDLALLMGMCKVIVDDGLFDHSFIEKHCDNFEDFKESLDDFSLGRVERITGVSRDMVENAAMIYATGKPAAIFCGTGITQYAHGTYSVLGLVNLSILTGNIEHSYGLIPLWGQNNALGACDMGCLPDFYPNYQVVSNPKIRKRFETFWGKSLNHEPGLTLREIIDAILGGKIKALYIIGSDLITSLAPSKKIKDALKKAKFVVVQDMFFNETAKFAHTILPAASFAEKDGTFTNTEGRIQKINKAMEPAGNSRPDWQIICDLARKLGSNGFNFNSVGEIMSEISSITTGLSAQNKKFTFTSLQYKPPAEATDIDYPLILTTERDLYSGGFLSRKVEGLDLLRTKNLIYINPKDAVDFGINDGEMVRVISRWSEICGEARLTNLTPAGLVAMNLQEEKMNELINPSLDKVSKIPEIKLCAVRIVPQREFQDE
ncbi:MAG: molybdopterin-dependent oxidoreductase [Nitrospirota bacterium]